MTIVTGVDEANHGLPLEWVIGDTVAARQSLID